MEIVCCIAMCLLGSYWNIQSQYIPSEFGVTVAGVLNFFTYFLLLNTMLPISLMVTMEVVKVC